MKTEPYIIEGMSCAACSGAVERVTRKLEGVSASDVNLIMAKMTITYDESQLTPERIMAAVERAGFGIRPDIPEPQQTATDDADDDHKASALGIVLAALFSALLMYVSMGHMIGLPLPPFLSGAENGLRFALTQLVLTVPVLILRFRPLKFPGE